MAVYSTDHSAAVVKMHGWRTVENSTPYLIPYLKPDMKILDLGCGPGSISIDFARRTPKGHVTGVEYVEDPLGEARETAKREGVTNIDFRVGDIQNLELPDNSFDLVHVHQVLQHIGDPVKALREMRRVAKSDGGIVAVRESAYMHWYPDSAALTRAQELRHEVMRARGGNPDPGRMIHVWAEQAGFARDKIRKSAGTWCYSTPEERQYWGGTMKERTTGSGFSKLAIDGGFATKEDLKENAKGWTDWITDEDGWYAVLHGEIVCFKS